MSLVLPTFGIAIPFWVRLALLLAAIILMVWPAISHIAARRRNGMFYILVILLGVTAVIVGTIGYFRSDSAIETSAAALQKKTEAAPPPSFRHIFDKDLPSSGGSIEQDLSVNDKKYNKEYVLPVRIIWEARARTKFLAVFVPRDTDGVRVCISLLNNLQKVFALFDNIDVLNRIPGDTSPSLIKDAIFSNIVYFYMENDMSLSEQADIERAFNEAGIKTQFFGHAYYILRRDDPMFREQTSLPAASGK